jgi:hypothetical protein
VRESKARVSTPKERAGDRDESRLLCTASLSTRSYEFIHSRGGRGTNNKQINEEEERKKGKKDEFGTLLSVRGARAHTHTHSYIPEKKRSMVQGRCLMRWSTLHRQKSNNKNTVGYFMIIRRLKEKQTNKQRKRKEGVPVLLTCTYKVNPQFSPLLSHRPPLDPTMAMVFFFWFLSSVCTGQRTGEGTEGGSTNTKKH